MKQFNHWWMLEKFNRIKGTNHVWLMFLHNVKKTLGWKMTKICKNQRGKKTNFLKKNFFLQRLSAPKFPFVCTVKKKIAIKTFPRKIDKVRRREKLLVWEAINNVKIIHYKIKLFIHTFSPGKLCTEKNTTSKW